MPADQAVVSLKDFEQRAGQRLDAGQRKLIESFATDTRQTAAGIGPAGTGKTTAMRALAHVLDADGRRLVPLESSGAAAAVLTAELDLPAENVRQLQLNRIQQAQPEYGTYDLAFRDVPIQSNIQDSASPRLI